MASREMVWLMRVLVICAFVGVGWLRGGHLHTPVFNFGEGLMVIGLAVLIGKLGKWISRKAPTAAWYVGWGFYWLGVMYAAAFLLLVAYASYEVPSDIINPLADSFWSGPSCAGRPVGDCAAP
jgi:hypothetical protein